MTRKMEEFFNLPPSDEQVVEEELPAKTKEQLMVEAKEIYTAMTTTERVDAALPMVNGLDTHDNEMDDIAGKAVRTFEDLMSLGGNVPDMHAGKIYEVGAQMLKIALEAKNAKAEKKLRMIELQLKKIRAEQIDAESGNGPRNIGAGGEFDRNELLKYIVSSKTENSDK